jgi:hypothetical protein
METFTQLNGKPPFDWNAFLSQKEFTADQLINASDLAGEWVTCACGNLCAAIPRKGSGEPLDNELAELGHDFSEAIFSMESSHSWNYLEQTAKWQKQASGILKLIEARSIELLKPLVP